MTDKILIDRELFERVQDVLSRWSEIINYQYCGSMEAMAYLQVTDDMSQPVLNEVNAALNAPQQEAVAEVTNSGTGAVLYRDAHVEGGDLLYTHPAPSVPEGDEENQAVRMFLMMYGGKACTIEQMRRHLECAGYAGCWPEWAANASGHLSKGGAQSWIRHMLSAAPKAQTTDDRKDAELDK